MAGLKTQATDIPVAAFIAAIEPEARRDEVRVLDALFRRASGRMPRVWGSQVLGYGSYSYRQASGQAATWYATGFAARKSALSIHILPGYADHADLRARLGRHSAGKSCLYVKALSDIDLGVLEALVRRGLADLAAQWPLSD